MVAAAPHVSQRLLLVLAEIGGDKGWYLETARADLSGGIGSPSVFRPPSGHPRARWSVPRQHPTQAPHFLPMMVRASRAGDLLAKSDRVPAVARVSGRSLRRRAGSGRSRAAWQASEGRAIARECPFRSVRRIRQQYQKSFLNSGRRHDDNVLE